MAEMITPHFTRDELKCPCGCDKMEMSERTLNRLEAARLIYGKPITLASAYRCATRNLAVGGKPNSPHLTGHAVDPRRPSGGALLIAMIDAFRGAGFHGFGMGDGRLHFDDHPVLGERAWMYP